MSASIALACSSSMSMTARHDGRASLESLLSNLWPAGADRRPTHPRSGWHCVLAVPARVSNTAGQLGAGSDIRTTGGYSRSPHPSAEMVPTAGPAAMPPTKSTSRRHPPGWSSSCRPTRRPPRTAPSTEDGGPSHRLRPGPRPRGRAHGPPGQHNNTLYVAARARRFDLPPRRPRQTCSKLPLTATSRAADAAATISSAFRSRSAS